MINNSSPTSVSPTFMWNLKDGGTFTVFKQFLSEEEANQILFSCSGLTPNTHWEESAIDRASLKWKKDMITVGNRSVVEARYTCFLGERDGLQYTYSKKLNVSERWPEVIESVKSRIEELIPYKYNVVLCNLYTSGQDHVSWHSDSEEDLVPGSSIVILSVGYKRLFQLKNNKEVLIGQIQTKINTLRKSNDTQEEELFNDSEKELLREFGLEGENQIETENRVKKYKVGQDIERNKELEVENGDLVLMSGDIQKNWRHRIVRDQSIHFPRIAFTFRAVNE